LFARARAPVTDELEARGHLVVLGPGHAGPHALATALAPGDTTVAQVRQRFCCPVGPEPAPGPVWTKLAALTLELLQASGSKATRIEPAVFAYPDSPIEDLVALAQIEPCTLDELGEIEDVATGVLARRRTLVVNVGHPTVRELVALAHGEPAFAAYLLAKAVALGRTLDPRIDARLATEALARR